MNMNFSALDSRNRRNLLAHSMNAFSPPFHRNYSTDRTVEMKTPYGDSLLINTVHLIPEPMKLNLADSVVTLDEKVKPDMAAETKGFVNNHNMKNPPNNPRSAYQYPSLAGIASFFTGVFNVMGGIFQKRANSPVQYYDCFEQGYEDHHQMTPSSRAWQPAKREDQNKNGRAEADGFDETYTEFEPDMSEDYRAIAAQCEDKLNKVRLLLTSNTVHRTSTARPRRPKRAFHEAGSVEELFEDAFTPEDFISIANETFLEYCSPFNLHHDERCEVESLKTKTETAPVEESMGIVQTLPPNNGESKTTDNQDTESKRQIVTSCEDKVSQLKALLQSRRQKNKCKLDIPTNLDNKTVATPIPSTDTKETEVIFAKEIDIPPPSPNCLDPNSYFDEVTGRFFSSSATDSEDSFQIVFSDSPKNSRKRIPSDCDSEDSFIVFEDNPENCYTTNDVFGDELVSDSEDSDCESDFDAGGTITLSHSLSRTFGDLTDGSLYEENKSEDVVDCAFRSGSEVPGELIEDAVTSVVQEENGDRKRGLLLDEAKKRERRNQPAKKVRFSSQPPKVHVMRVWAFAARQARAGHWERHALDRERFKRRIADVDMAVSWVLKPQHRARVMFQRFMPWWNALKRKEIAEQKQREEERLAREDAERLAAGNKIAEERMKDTQDETEDIINVSSVVNCNVVNANVDSESIENNSNRTDRIDNDKKSIDTDPKDIRNGNADLNGNGHVNGVLNDEQKILKGKLIDSSQDFDKSKLIENTKIVDNLNSLKNGVKKPDFKMICYQQQQAL